MIDIHTHLHPPRLFAAIRKWFAEKSDWKLYHPTEPLAVAACLKRSGVEHFAFCSYAHKPGIAAEINQWLVDVGVQLAGFGFPLATIHPDDRSMEDYAAKAFGDGCIGLKIHEDVQKIRLDDPRLGTIYDMVAKRRGFVLVHVGPIPWDNTPKDGPQRVCSVLNAHPDVNFVIAHLGAPDTYEYLSLMKRFANLYIDTTMSFVFQPKMPRPIDRAALVEHSERILFGSDFPNIPYEYDFEINKLRSFQLPEAVERNILHDNGRRLLNV